MSPKQQAQLEKRAKELDAREEYLKKWEAGLKSGPLDIKVLTETIKARQNQLDGLNHAINENVLKLNEQKRQSEQAENGLKARTLQINAELNKLDDQISDKKQELKGVKSQLATTEKELSERKSYLREQEHLITDKTDEGNNTLVNLQAEIRDFEGQKQIIEQEVTDLEASKTDILFQQQQATEQFNAVKANLDEQEQSLSAELTKYKRKLAEAQETLNKTNEEVDKKLQTLKIKEEELLAKRDAINTERLQLDEDKRRWTSTKSLYQL